MILFEVNNFVSNFGVTISSIVCINFLLILFRFLLRRFILFHHIIRLTLLQQFIIMITIIIKKICILNRNVIILILFLL